MAGIELATAYVSIVASAKGLRDDVAKELKGVEGDGKAAGQALGGNVSAGFTAGAAGMAGKAKATGTGVKGALLGGLAGMGGAAKALMGGAIAGGALAAGKALYDIGATFDDVTDTIRVGTGATGKNLEGLVDVAKNVGRTVPASFEDIGATVADLNTTLGYSGPTLEGVAAQVLELGRLTGAPVNIRDLGSAFSGFKVPAEQAGSALDDIYRISQATGVPVNELTSALKSQGGILSQVGFGFKDSAAMIGVLSKAGIDSNTVVKSMGRSLMNLAKEGEKPSEAFKRVVGEIEGFIKKGDEAAALQLAGKVFGTRGAPQFVAALRDGKVSLDDMAAAAGTTGDTIMGAAGDTADFAEQWAIFKNNVLVGLEPLATAVFTAIGDGMAKINEMMPSVIAGLQGFGAWWGENSAWLNPLAAVLAGVAVALVALAAAGAIAAGVASVFGAAMAVLTSPITGVIVGIGLLIAAIVALWKNWDTIKAKAAEVWESVKAKTSEAWAAIAGAVSGAVNSVFAAISGAFGRARDFVAGVWNALVGLTVAVWSRIFAAVGNYLGRVVGSISANLSRARGFVAGVWNALVGLTVAVWSRIFAAVGGALGRVVGAISGGMSRARGLVSAALAAISGLWSAGWARLVSVVSGIAGQVANAAWGVMQAVQNVFAGAGYWLWDAGQRIVSGLVDGLRSMFGHVQSTLSGLTSLIPSWKGPRDRDSVLLTEAGELIIGSLLVGFRSRYGDVRRDLAGLTDLIEGGVDPIMPRLGTPRVGPSRATSAAPSPAISGRGGGGVHITVNNPIAEPTSRTTNRALGTLALMGQIGGRL